MRKPSEAENEIVKLAETHHLSVTYQTNPFRVVFRTTDVNDATEFALRVLFRNLRVAQSLESDGGTYRFSFNPDKPYIF